MVERRMPRIQDVVIPVLREQLPHVAITSWIPDVDKRTYPIVNVRRLGGLPVDPAQLDRAVLEVTALSRDGLVGTEDLLLDARLALWRAVQNQTVTESGYLHSYFETMGPTQFDSPYQGSWRVQMLVQLGLRPARKKE